jgi:SAM-dependent methyltransferase
MSYRQQFSTVDNAQAYDEQEYGAGSYGQLLWQIEQAQLAQIFATFRRTHAKVDVLDFAAGSGRILSFVERLSDSAVGIEISEQMAERARQRVERAPVLCRDITVPGAQIEGTYDIITAFRFILNAEPALRRSAMLALRQRLRDRSSLIIFNNHGNMWSHKAILYPLHAARHGRGPKTSGNYLSHRQVTRLAKSVGLRVQRAYGCGVIGARLTRALPEEHLLRWETTLAASPLSWIAVNQMYVARLA